MRENRHGFWLSLVLLLFLFLLIGASKSVMAAVCDAMLLCYQTVIPSLFPFLVLSACLMKSGFPVLCARLFAPLMRPVFGVGGIGAVPFVVGMLSGYPVGAKVIAGLFRDKKLSKQEAERLLPCSNNAGPLFVMGAVGTGLLHNQGLGTMLYCVHVIAAVLVGVVLGACGRKQHGKGCGLPAKVQAESLSFQSVSDAVSDSLQTMLLICSYIILFAAFSAIILPVAGQILPSFLTLSLHGLLEVAGGSKTIILSTLSPRIMLSLLAFCLGTGGLCVMMQVSGVLRGSGLGLHLYVAGKLLQGFFSAVLVFFLYPLVPLESQTVFAGVASVFRGGAGCFYINSIVFFLCMPIFFKRGRGEKTVAPCSQKKSLSIDYK
ncbi:MAG: hypothetical protein E7402_01995 [Ruminococcaceae bacterium]|nr:hypothetical protein [Oscillospiraceae bacterium]